METETIPYKAAKLGDVLLTHTSEGELRTVEVNVLFHNEKTGIMEIWAHDQVREQDHFMVVLDTNTVERVPSGCLLIE